jgi:hypothetical protein
MPDFTELREFTPEQQARICDVFCQRLARDQALPRNHSAPAVERRESTQPEHVA